MRLIQKIEIRYFRSLYRADLNPCEALNIIFGRNDSGKSNVLRSLNLFFNNRSDPTRSTNFKIDLSDTRLGQAQQGQSRQFYYVKLYINVPQNYRASLGESVWIKKQWNRDGVVNTIYPSGLSTGSKIQLTKLLSKIDYTYIPAIKDNESFSRLVRRMYEATSEGAGLQAATHNFINSIRAETADLSDALSATLGSVTRLDAPPEMGELFKALDFTHGEGEHSLLLQKGDGIKARHIPELLRYINDKEATKSYFIWGFEEPENSLDLSAAILEAAAFSRFSKRTDTQIFVTSHSPAFYLGDAEHPVDGVRRFFISKQNEFNGVVTPSNAVQRIDDLDHAEIVMEAANLSALPYVIRKLGALEAQRAALEEDYDRLTQQLENINQATLFVEGESESEVFSSGLGEWNIDLAVRKLRGTPTTTSELIKRIVGAGGRVGGAPSFFLFDNDTAGRNAYRNLTSQQRIGEPTTVCEGVHAWCLPMTEEFSHFTRNMKIPQEKAFYPLEFIYDGELAALCLMDLMDDTEIEDSQIRIRQEYHESLSQEQAHKLKMAPAGSREWLWARGVPNKYKAEFFRRCDDASVPSSFSAVVDKITALIG